MRVRLADGRRTRIGIPGDGSRDAHVGVVTGRVGRESARGVGAPAAMRHARSTLRYVTDSYRNDEGMTASNIVYTCMDINIALAHVP